MNKMIESEFQAEQDQALLYNVVDLNDFRSRKSLSLADQQTIEIRNKIQFLLNELEILVKTGDSKFSASF